MLRSSQLASLKADAEANLNMRETLKSELSESLETLNDTQSELETKSETIFKLEAKNAELQERKAVAENDVLKISALKNEISALKGNMTLTQEAFADEKESDTQEIQTLRDQITSLQDTISVTQEALADEKENAMHEIRALKSELELKITPAPRSPIDAPNAGPLREKVASLEKTLAATTRNLENTAVLLARANAEKEKLETDDEERFVAKMEIEELRVQLKKAGEKHEEAAFMASMEMEELKSKNAELEKKIENSSKTDPVSAKKMDELTLANEALKGYLTQRASSIISQDATGRAISFDQE